MEVAVIIVSLDLAALPPVNSRRRVSALLDTGGIEMGRLAILVGNLSLSLSLSLSS